jgi:hypothetical protein
MGAVPYFNCQYAKDHGFLAWLLLGEIVPTLKATVWPYFVMSPLWEKSWTEEEKRDLEHMRRGFTAANKAMILIEPGYPNSRH